MHTRLLPIGFIFAMIILTVTAVVTSQTLTETKAVAAEQQIETHVARVSDKQ